MNTLEREPRFDEMSGLKLELDLGMDGFDINAAFQGAIANVASDQQLALDEKVRRMEVIVSEGTSEVYRDFVDFRTMAAYMAMMCNHDHAFNQSLQGSRALSSFMDNHKVGDGLDHANDSLHSHNDDEIDTKTNKKKKKKRGWFGVYR